MEIFINNKIASITLESEKTVGEVLAGIHQWLEGSGFFLSGLELDGKTYGSHSLDAVFDMPLDGIGKINIKTSGKAELMLEALVGLKQDLEFYETLNEAEKEECKKRWKSAVPALFIKQNTPDLYDLVIKTLNGGFPAAGTCALVSERIREIEDPIKETANSLALINETAQRLEELPLDIQTGKDARASETITLFSSLAEKMFRIVSLLEQFGIDSDSITVTTPDGDLSLKTSISEFSAALKEMAAAYENNDTVLVGDLAEYELSPRLLTLSKAIAEIKMEKNT